MPKENKEKVIIIGGPTGVGKSAIALDLAKRIGGEVLSADSVQVYKGFDIGSGKLGPQEREGVVHHFLDHAHPLEDYNVAKYSREVRERVQEVLDRGKHPIVCGGSGLYIDALIYNLDFSHSKPDLSLRRDLEELYEEKGLEVLYDKLRDLDPLSAQNTDAQNPRRVIRALEIVHQGGQKKAQTHRPRNQDYDFYYFILDRDRAQLYDRINKRVDKMLKEGLVQEVEGLIETYGKAMPALRTIGYKEILAYLEGDYDLEEATEEIKKHSRNYAKRQLSWLRREDQGIWIQMEGQSSQEILEEILHHIHRDEVEDEKNN
ncbi:MAG: tRNA (adenosine(37)-N6)-dimethylallyltransferase MiaA [Tissierellia bacterium]|nr:tRNA (adenosine(37)-N6)-dimethylallyltransferase MiaA [Tissierellia bacterium]